MAALADVRKKWHISPAFSVEFIGYYLDRISRVKEIKKNLRQQIELNSTLMEDQKRLRENYDDVSQTLYYSIIHSFPPFINPYE